MKRLFFLMAIALALVSLRYYDTGVLRNVKGELTVYSRAEQEDFLPCGDDVYRVDLAANEDIDKLMAKIAATTIFTEDGGKLVYAYSPLIPASIWLKGKRINLMIYNGKNSVSIGVPILKGCY